ncbi:hypothetical protein EBAPG3_007895 [Nitrosospira lacus]|uniref:Uncharacterized protein n=1 Tax=Nitrosospira lacus TaxID=1288494 RepID=A0A1W6SPJ5_9PROT|nr:hypothetical protein [Nitrosospira lacus]ARO87701.1 hypothetical protein EBAPG3_007895 [Nitrosospira lacus]
MKNLGTALSTFSAVVLLTSPLVANGATIGPTPYFSFADSPFATTPFDYFHLENFEDGSLMRRRT